MREGMKKLRDLKERTGELEIPDASLDQRLEHVLNLRAMLTAAEAVMRGALAREESRGAH
ncbi:MAG: succinate dehydrogenase, partial [Actinomycetota bacterium]|nr:succinate dehydrogenase [Actinomycetota bacterium]